MSNNIFQLIFSESDNIFITDLNANYGHYRQLIVRNNTTEIRNFFCINPIAGNLRQKSEVKAYRNFLFESDAMPIDQQISLLPKIAELGIVASAVFSAGKSIHFIVSCSDELKLGEPGSESANERYRAIWLGLCRILTEVGLNVDKSNKNPVNLSRMANADRNGSLQTLLYTGNLVNSEFLNSVAITYNKPIRVVSSIGAKTLQEFEELLEQPQHSHIRTYLKYPTWINREHGNYPMLFRLTTWAIDEVGVPLETFITYFEKHTLTHLLNKQYHKDWKKPIYDAYYHKKGLL